MNTIASLLAALAGIPAAVTIDGRLDEAMWRTTARRWTAVDRRIAPNRARFFLDWDETYLYFAAEVEDANVVGTHGGRKAQVWLDDAVELFLDFGDLKAKDRTPLTFEYGFSVAGGVNWTTGLGCGDGARFPGYEWPPAWDSKVESAVRLSDKTTRNQTGDTDRGYVVEARIPWSELGTHPPFAANRLIGVNCLNIAKPEQTGDDAAPLSVVPGIDFSNNHKPSLWMPTLAGPVTFETSEHDAFARRTQIRYGPQRRRVGCFYYTWYGRPEMYGKWAHWTGVDVEKKTIASSTNFPRRDAYDSQDAAIVAQHVAEMKRAGITTIIATWWGNGTVDDQVLPVLLETAGEAGLEVTVYYERVPRPGEPASMVEDLIYLLGRYGRHPAWAKVDGKPVVFVYIRAMNQLRASQFAQVFTWAGTHLPPGVFAQADGFTRTNALVFDGVHAYNPVGRYVGRSIDAIRQRAVADSRNAVRVARRSGRLASMTVLPGYDDRKVRQPGLVLDRFDGATYRHTFEAAIAADPDWILITSYNEWHEGTEIEPSVELGDQYLALTRRYAPAFTAKPPAKPVPVGEETPPRLAASRRSAALRQLRATRIAWLGGYSDLVLATMEHHVALEAVSWEQVARGAVTAEKFPVLLYSGAEEYTKTVPGHGSTIDGLRKYLAGGGCLLVAPSMPFPFYRDRVTGRTDIQTAAVGLSISGGPRPDAADFRGGFESPTGAARYVTRGPAKGLGKLDAYGQSGDPRFRPSLPAGLPAGARYAWLVRLVGADGRPYGDALSVVDHTRGPLAGGRTVYVSYNLTETVHADDVLTLAAESAFARRDAP